MMVIKIHYINSINGKLKNFFLMVMLYVMGFFVCMIQELKEKDGERERENPIINQTTKTINDNN